jgi:hypothetical protein
MSPVSTIVLPHNGRMDVDPSGSEAVLGAYVTLPIPVPLNVTVWTSPVTGKPLAMWADDARIRPADFATVWHGVQQFNHDLLGQGVGLTTVVESELESEPADPDEDGPEGPSDDFDHRGGFGRP